MGVVMEYVPLDMMVQAPLLPQANGTLGGNGGELDADALGVGARLPGGSKNNAPF